ncbi:hypothetical protein Tcan_09961 [Toxocara canis]|uniref:Uncharacterized protein n=1 Tax=Toxocara canis TaxID=6265 RepID=A0A0B2V575_TOXCA|nr:hypothetical protein Tcan_09961 [Toxocara canis]
MPLDDSVRANGNISPTCAYCSLLHHPLAGLQFGADVTAKLIADVYSQQSAKLKNKSKNDDVTRSPNSKRVHFDFDVQRFVYSDDGQSDDSGVCI